MLSSIQAMLRLRALLAETDVKMSSSRDNIRPAKRDSPSWMKRHFAATLSPGARPVVAIAPALTIGFVRPSASRSIPVSELKAWPVAFTPIFFRISAAPIMLHNRANTKGFAALMMANS